MRLTVGLYGDLGDSLGEETGFESGGLGEQSSVTPTRGNESEQFVSEVRGICSDDRCLVPDSGT